MSASTDPDRTSPNATDTVSETMDRLATGPDGLSSQEAARRLEQYGPNALAERSESALRALLSYFWGPIPWMIEIAAILSAIVQHWDDLAIVVVLLMFNAAVGFWQEHQAANAVDALKNQLAMRARVRRDGSWSEIDSTALVPGDVVRVRLGDVVPADVTVVDGEYLSVDQSALTGESLPVDKHAGDTAYSGSVAKQGEVVALVTCTGGETFFGRTAHLVSEAAPASHFQRAVLQIGNYLIYLSVGLAAVLLVVQMFRGAEFVTLVQFVLILVVAAIPVAMPAVLSVTMAIGARTLAGMRAIVARLESIEEMAGIDVLCSDKTGTLTQNTLTLGPPVLVGAADAHQVVLAGALASRAEDEDPIDRAVLAGLEGPEAAAGYVQEQFLPFDPVGKRTEAQVRSPDGRSFRVSKGAPQAILELCDPPADVIERVRGAVDETARQGMRALGVARSDDGTWRFLGVLPLFDPPRDDSADTIDQAKRHGIAVKMVTGDDTAIAAHIAAELGLGTDIRPAETFFPADASADAVRGEDVERADGFARVFPEHKYRIVKALQARDHIVGMTGDGVNDAPALKQADTGVAVSGATDAARAAADVVLTAPGLSVVVRAVEESRRIFERMNSYAVYRITETIRIMFFVVAAMVAFDMYPITAMMIILLALLNDLPIMAIAYDRTWLDPQPVRWDMHRVLSVSTVLGLIGVLETFGLLVLARDWLGMAGPALQTFIFLKLAVSGHLTLFVARTRHAFTSRPFPAPVLVWSAVVTKLLATLLVAFGLGLVTPITWGQIGVVWAYCLVFLVIEDRIKLAVYRSLSLDHAGHRRFLATVRDHVHPFGQLHGAR